MPDPRIDPSPTAEPWYRRAMRRAGLLARRDATAEEAERARAGAERINTALPEFVSGRPAVLKRREYYRQADEASRSE